MRASFFRDRKRARSGRRGGDAGPDVRLLLLGLSLLALGLVFPPCEKPQPVVIGDLEVMHPRPVEWTELEPGLEFTRLEFRRLSDQSVVALVALRVDPGRFRFGLLSAPELMKKPSAWINQMRKKASALAAVNASFYLPDTFEPVGMVVSKARVVHPWKAGAGSGLFRVKDGRARIEWARSYRPEWEKEDLALQAGPLLVEPGGGPGIYQNRQKYRSRTALGIDQRHRVILFCTPRRDDKDPELSGLDLYELMEIVRLEPARGGFGLPVALNLDGGTSSALDVAHPGLKLEIRSVHPVRNGIAIFRK